VSMRFSYSTIPTAVIRCGSPPTHLELFPILVYAWPPLSRFQHLVRQVRWNKCIGHIPFSGISVGCLVSPAMRSTAARIGSTWPPLTTGTCKLLISGDIGEIFSWSKSQANRLSGSKVMGLEVFVSFWFVVATSCVPFSVCANVTRSVTCVCKSYTFCNLCAQMLHVL
jgi:hypothetical protein